MDMKLWRAQLGHGWDPADAGEDEPILVPGPFRRERMKPPSERAREGRANPKGIPHLHASTHLKTALAEVHPWIGSWVSVAVLTPVRDLRILNCTEDAKRKLYVGGVPEEDWDTRVWCDIDDAFSTPVTPSDDQADYAPTQIIAETFKAIGFDGVAYRSALGDGHNVALFDVDSADVAGCSAYRVGSVSLEAELAGYSYAITLPVLDDQPPPPDHNDDPPPPD
jgi:hypothetical protein